MSRLNFAARLAAVVTVALGAAGAHADLAHPAVFEYLGELALPPGAIWEGEAVGGISSLAWDEREQLFLALSDDRGEHAPPRYYRLRLDLEQIGRGSAGISLVERVRLGGIGGAGYAVGAIDPEGFARASSGELFLSTEGVARDAVAPFVARLDADGNEAERFALPERVLPDGAGERGVRDNLGFESLAVTPGGQWLVAGLENAVVADGPIADVGVPSPSRLFAWDLAEPGPPREYLYRVDAVVQSPPRPDALRVNGLVELLALSNERLWTLEREYVLGGRNRVRLYEVDLAPSLGAPAGRQPGLATKRLLLDLDDLGLALDNFEGMAFGPTLADGRRVLVLVSDDNFNPLLQATRFLVFAVDFVPPAIAAVQGAGYRSPLEGRWLAGLEGVVTAIDARARPPAMFVESEAPDDDPATSEGLRVEWSAARELAVGDRVRLHGRVLEALPGARQLTVTTLVASSVERLARDVDLPPAPLLGSELRVPDRIDDDALERFEPARDAIDFWESLEGMRVVADGRSVTGPTTAYDELVLALDQRGGEATSRADGYLLTAAGPRLDRAFVSGRLVGGLPQLAVGSRLTQPVAGVVDYGFSNYRILATRPLAVASASSVCEVRTGLWATDGRLRVATFNVENLSVAGPPERFTRLAEAIVNRLGAPQVLALQEVQDDSGTARGDGVVTAAATLARLTAAVAAAGGPLYDWVQIDPELDREGGVPGGNIRVALLFDPASVALPRRGTAGPLDAVEIHGESGAPALQPNPGRVAPGSAAFTLASGEGVRRSLAVELAAGGVPWYFVVNHWSSKYDDGRPFGAVQPPPAPTAAKRLAQAEVIRAFAEALLAVDPEARVVVLGDLNDLPWSAPLVHLSRPPLLDLAVRLPEPTRYSYNFEGSAQLIDHLVVSPALARDAEAEIVHLNSDCPEAVRTSDHDAVLASLPLPAN